MTETFPGSPYSITLPGRHTSVPSRTFMRRLRPGPRVQMPSSARAPGEVPIKGVTAHLQDCTLVCSPASSCVTSAWSVRLDAVISKDYRPDTRQMIHSAFAGRHTREALENPSAAPVRVRSSQLAQGDVFHWRPVVQGVPSVSSRKFMRRLQLGPRVQLPSSAKTPGETPIK